MATKKELVERRAEKAKGYRDLIDNAEKEDRGLTKNEDEKIVGLQKEMGDLDVRIQRAEEKEKEEKRAADLDDLQKRSDGIGGSEADVEQRNAFIQFLRGGIGSLSTEQRGLLHYEKRAGEGQKVSSDTKGGYLVAKTLSDKVLVALKSKGGFLAEVNMMLTSKGGEILIPILNDTDAEAVIVGEGALTERGDKTFSTASVKAFTYRSVLIPVSFELLEDTEYDIEQLLADCISNSIYRAVIKHITIGDGVGKPQGILVGATKGIDAAANAITLDNLIDLEAEVDEDYLINAKWMFNRKTLAKLKKLKDTTGQYLWQPKLDASNPATIMGYPYVINPYMPDVGTGTKSVIFGDLKQYTVRQVNKIGIRRLDERLADELNVGFFGFARFDGKLMDAGTHPVKYIQHA